MKQATVDVFAEAPRIYQGIQGGSTHCVVTVQAESEEQAVALALVRCADLHEPKAVFRCWDESATSNELAIA